MNKAVMETLLSMRIAVDTAIEAVAENETLREERDHWKSKYNKLLNDSIKHSEQVSANMLSLALRAGK